ncbi:MAG TPA: histidine phosphatase family protein [Planctomycetota bacterium]|nr:histidine phosphatase family protein [Planctomycetota bacterium]
MARPDALDPSSARRRARIFVVRHGETAWSKIGRHTGSTDLPLIAAGRVAARRLRPALSRETFALVLTSPLRRARETCSLSGLGDRAVIDGDLREWDYGDYEGLTHAQIDARRPGWVVFRDGCPGGESPAQVAARADRVLARVRTASGNVAIFAHGHISRVLTARWLGLPPVAGRHFLLDTARLGILVEHDGAPALETWNAAV